MTIYMWIATFAWACLVLGYLRRKDTKTHVPLVVVGILTDVLLVIYLQITRSAVQTALEFSLGPLQQIHIAFSSIALILYVPTLVLGVKLYRKIAGDCTKSKHKKLAIAALIFRTLGFLFMFSMWK